MQSKEYIVNANNTNELLSKHMPYNTFVNFY